MAEETTLLSQGQILIDTWGICDAAEPTAIYEATNENPFDFD